MDGRGGNPYFLYNVELENCLTVINCCNADSICENISILGVNENSSDRFIFYLNPFNETLQISIVNGADELNCTVFNQSGKQVVQSMGCSKEIILSSADFPMDIYVIRLHSKKRRSLHEESVEALGTNRMR